MKNTLTILILSTFVLLITSCEKEETYLLDTVEYKSQKNIRDYPDFPQFKPVKLKFKRLTKESKMGKFYANKIVEFNGRLWSVGGYLHGTSYPDRSSEVWSSTDGSNWGLVSNGQFDGRRGHSLTVFDGKMWLIGGHGNSGFLSDVWFSSDGVQWTLATNTPAFGQIVGHSTTVFNNKLVVFTINNVWQSSDGINWELMAEDIFTSRFYSELTVFNDKLYLIGGLNGSEAFYNEIWQSTNGTDWSQVPITSPIFKGMLWFSTANYKHKLWVIGGLTETNLVPSDETIWFSTNMIDWHKYDDPIPAPLSRYVHSSLVYQDRVLVFGGISSSGKSGSIWSFEEAN